MRLVIILSLLCVSVLLPPLRQVAKVESPDSGAQGRLKWSQSNTKQRVGAISNGPLQIPEKSTSGQSKIGEPKVVNLLRKGQKLLENVIFQLVLLKLCLVESMQQVQPKKEKILRLVNNFLNNLKLQLKRLNVFGERND